MQKALPQVKVPTLVVQSHQDMGGRDDLEQIYTRDPDPTVRQVALDILARGPGGQDAVWRLFRAAPSTEARIACLRALTAPRRSEVPALLQVATQGGVEIRQAVAGVLKGALRNVDICARLGGEEFAILLPNTPGENAYHVADRVRRTLGDTRYTGLGLPPEVNITISVGVATCPRDATALAELLELADKALYAAMADGRDQVRQHARAAH